MFATHNLHVAAMTCLPLLLLLGLATAMDVHGRRIPNWLTIGLAFGGIAQSMAGWGLVPPTQSLLGLVVGFMALFLLFAIGAVGGGDVKLMAAVGAWVGPIPILAIFCIAAVVGMAIVLAQALWQGRVAILLRNSLVLVLNFVHIQQFGAEHVAATGHSSHGVEKPLPYAAPIFAATALVLVAAWKMGW